MKTRPFLFEVCCGSAEDALNARAGGADRAELCSDLFHGGLTPSLGSLLTVKAAAPDFPVMCMVRPREGGFCYTAVEFGVMCTDARAFLEHGADGIVFGFLREDGTIDEARCRALLDIAGKKETVFHRAFDLVPDPEAALETLIRLGFTRVLTSGQKPTVPEGVPLLRRLIAQAGDRIQVMPGAGITAENAAWCRRETGARCLHAATHRTAYDRSAAGNPAIYFGGCVYPPEDRFYVTASADVAQFLRAAAGDQETGTGAPSSAASVSSSPR